MQERITTIPGSLQDIATSRAADKKVWWRRENSLAERLTEDWELIEEEIGEEKEEIIAEHLELSEEEIAEEVEEIVAED